MATVPPRATGQVWARRRHLLAGGSVLGMLVAHGPVVLPVSASSSLTWSGPAAAAWSSPGSWSPARRPEAGDSLAFGASPGLLSPSLDDVPSVTLRDISLSGRWSLDPAAHGSAPATTLSGTLSARLGSAPAPREARYRLPTTLADDITVGAAPADAVLVYGGQTRGRHTITTRGPGAVSFTAPATGSHTFAGVEADGASESRVDFGGPAAAPAGPILVDDGASAGFADGTYDNDLTLAGRGASGAPGALRAGAGSSGASPVFTGLVDLADDATFATGAVPASVLKFQGGIRGPHALTLTGKGTVLLEGANTYAGPTNVQNRTALVNGSLSGAVDVGPGAAALGGAGSISGPLTVGAGSTLEPGPALGAAGTLTAGGLKLLTGSTLVAVIGGEGRGGQVVATGPVSLGGDLVPKTASGYQPSGGQSFTIIRNLSGRPVSGSFRGLPEGARFPAGLPGVTFEITYRGNGGGDVVLTVVGGATADGMAATLGPAAVPGAGQAVDDLAVAVTTPTVAPGREGTATVTVLNHGPAAAPAPVSVVYRAPHGARISSLTSGCVGMLPAAEVTCTITDPIPAGQEAAVAVSVGLPAGAPRGRRLRGGEASVMPASIASDPNPSNDRAPAEVRVAEASLGLTPLAVLPVLPASGLLPLAARSPASLAGLALGAGVEVLLSVLLVAFTRRWPGPRS